MCGIAGFLGFENGTELAKMANKTQHHRGPDYQSIWSDSVISLAHQRLSIIDLSENANQPFCKYNYVLVFNGEIYNYKILKEEISKREKIEFKSNSDTEIILEYYRIYKEKCLDFFVGMFAFAIYDKLANVLFLARDHFGIKPLFYTIINDGFAFASELKTLVNIKGFNKKINNKSLVSCLKYSWVPGNETMFENCWKLAPGHYMYVNKNSEFYTRKYWQLPIYNDFKLSEKEILEELDQVLHDSIERHLVADVPISSFLSGGLDSSFISVKAQFLVGNISTYTIATSEKDKRIEKMPEDEKYSKLLAKKFSFNHNEILIEPDIINLLPQIVETLDEPIGDPAAINTFLICQKARDNNVKVLLSGMGADEIFFGYRRQYATYLSQYYKKYFPEFLRTFVKNTVDQLPVRINNKGLRTIRWLKRFINFASLPIEQAYSTSYSYYNEKDLLELIKVDNANFIIKEILEEHKKIFYEIPEFDIVNKMCYTDLYMFMNGLNLTYTDRASMAASVEVRVPFIDKKVIEFVMNIPGEIKFKNKIPKYTLKKVAEKYLPKEVIYRPKASFGAPIRSWISNDLKALVDDLLSKESIEKRGILNYSMVKKLIDNDRKGISDNAYQIYQLLTLELWFRKFVD